MRSTRRGLLAALGGAATAGLAGCISGGSGSGGGGGGVEGCSPTEESPVQSLPAPSLGPAPEEAPLTLLVFEDFACPHCMRFSLNVLPKLRSNFVEPGKIRYEHHDFPIPVLEENEWSWRAASAARGVQDTTGDEAFFEFAHHMFEGYEKRVSNRNYSFSYQNVASAAEAADAPRCDIVGAAKYQTYRPVLEENRSLGNDLGLEGTPAIFIDDGSGEPTYINPEGKTNSYDAVASAIRSRL